MRWPWVSRTAFEVLREERDRLLHRIEQLELAVNQLVLVRTGQVHKDGTPRKARKPDENVVPRGVVKLINGFDNAYVREQQALEVAAARRNGVSWAEIEEALRNELEGEPEQPGAALGRHLDQLEHAADEGTPE